MRPFSCPLHFLLPFVSSIDQDIDMGLRNLTGKGLVRLLSFVVIDQIISIVSKIIMQALELRPFLSVCEAISDQSNFRFWSTIGKCDTFPQNPGKIGEKEKEREP